MYCGQTTFFVCLVYQPCFLFTEEKNQAGGSGGGGGPKKSDPVKVTFNLTEDAVKKLTELAQAGDYALRQLGILSLHVEGGKVRFHTFFHQHPF